MAELTGKCTISRTPIGELTAEEKWYELKRHIVESIKWYVEQQKNPKADHFIFFSKERCEKDILAYMMYLDGKKCKETELLIAILRDPAAYTVPPHPGFGKD